MEQVEKLEKMVVEDSKIPFSIDYIEEWCSKNDIKYNGMIDVIYTRD